MSKPQDICVDFTKLNDTSLQDGMLAYFLEQTKHQDVTVETRLQKEPFDFRMEMQRKPRIK